MSGVLKVGSFGIFKLLIDWLAKKSEKSILLIHMRIFMLNKRFLNWFKKKITNWFLKVVFYFELDLISLPNY